MLISYFIDLRTPWPAFSHLSLSTIRGRRQNRKLLPFYQIGPWGQEKRSNFLLPPGMATDLVSGTFLMPNLVLFDVPFVPSSISCGSEASPLLPTLSLPCCLHLCLYFCFLLAPMVKEFFSLLSSSSWGDRLGKEGVRIAVLPLSICKFISASISPKFWGVGKTEMGNRKSLLFVLVFDNVCNLSGWFKRFRYFL